MTNKIKDFRSDESGVIAIMFALLLPVFVAFAALAIDFSYAYKVRNTTQVSASAAALAGVSQLYDANGNHNPNDDGSLYRQEAVEYAYRNMNNAGNIVNSICGTFNAATNLANPDGSECNDVKAGYWSGNKFYAWDNTEEDGYDPEIMDLNSVQVTTRRSEQNTNPLQLFFAATVGLSEIDINTTAVATIGGGEITNGCLIALNNEDGSDETFHLNGTAEITTVGCDIRVDQCCSYPGGCQKGALHVNGTPLINVLAGLNGDVPGIIDVCGSVLSQGSATLDPMPYCSPEDGPNFVNCINPPSEESQDPLEDLAKNNVEWSDLADSMCDYYNFDVTKIDKPSYEYYYPEDVTTEVDPDTGKITKTYTVYPGTYCSDGRNNSKAFKFSGGGNLNIVFADGIFVMKDGKMDLAGAGNLSCDSCGFFLTGDPATLDWTGSNNISMMASTDVDNPLHGLLVVQNPFAPTTEDQEIKIAGSNDGSYYGGFYVPNADVKIVGTVNSSASRDEEDGCLYIIADEMEFSGTSGITASSSCNLFGGPDFTSSSLFFTLVN